MDEEPQKLRERAARALSLTKMEPVKDHRAPLIVLASIWLETAEQLERRKRQGRKTVHDLMAVINSADNQASGAIPSGA
jgi:hypothetical protein